MPGGRGWTWWTRWWASRSARTWRWPPPPLAGVRTHQLLLAVLGAAQDGSGRRGVARELALACARRGPYAGSAEELTPLRGDPLAGVPVVAAAIATLASPGAHRLFTEGAVESYALTPEAWGRIASVVPAGGRQDVHDPRADREPAELVVTEPPTVHQLRGDGVLGDAGVPEAAAQADRDDDEVSPPSRTPSARPWAPRRYPRSRRGTRGSRRCPRRSSPSTRLSCRASAANRSIAPSRSPRL